MTHPSPAFLFFLLLGSARAAPPVVIQYSCDPVRGPKSCAADLADCLAFPRAWVPRVEEKRFRCDVCWAEAYRCYMDCGRSFPLTFSSECLAACPRKYFDTCNPRASWRIPGDTSPPTPTPSDTPTAVL
jgi:hypothetical protein